MRKLKKIVKNGSIDNPSPGPTPPAKTSVVKHVLNADKRLFRVFNYNDFKVDVEAFGDLASIRKIVEDPNIKDVWIDLLMPESDLENVLEYFEVEYDKDEEEEEEEDFIVEDEDDRTILGFAYVIRNFLEVCYVYVVCFKNKIVTIRSNSHPKGPCESVMHIINDLIVEETDEYSQPLVSFRDFVFAQLMNSYAEEYIGWLSHITTQLNHMYRTLEKEDPLDVQTKLFEVHSNLTEVFSPTLFLMREFIRKVRKGGGRYLRTSNYSFLMDNAFQDVERAIDMKNNLEQTVDLISSAIRARISDETNKIMKILTIITTTMMPLTFLTGLYGQNFTHLPFSTSPYGFYLMLVVMLIVGGFMFLLFRRMRWFD